jgi:hypothetical protein
MSEFETSNITKERIKKYNNPIELDKAVKYPDIK